MPHKIAIIISRDVYIDSDYNDSTTVVDSITDWEEVTDEEFDDLRRASYKFSFQIIEQPPEPKKFIAKTIADYKTLMAKEKIREAEDKKKREAAALERKFKKELKDKESKIKMLKKLQAEFGEEVNKI